MRITRTNNLPKKNISVRNQFLIWVLYIATCLIFLFNIWGLNFRTFLVTLVFGLCIVLGEIQSVDLPQGSSVSVSSAIILASVLLKMPITNIYFFIALGIIIAIFFRKFDQFNINRVLIQFAKTIIAVLFSVRFAEFIKYEVALFPNSESILKIILIVLVFYLTDIAVEQIYYSLNQNVHFTQSFFGTVRLLGITYASLASTGVLIVLLYPSLQYWSLILFLIPLGVTRYSFNLYIDIRKTYQNTINALSATLEAQDIRRRGHARRVAELAVAMGRELGMGGRKLESLNFAALLHDIGKIGFDDEGEIAINTEDFLSKLEMEKHAQVGGEILRQVEYLSEAASIVEKYKTNSTGDEPLIGTEEDMIPLGSRILNLANYFDELTKTDVPGGKLSNQDALTKIKKDQGWKFDPKVVRALYNVVNRKIAVDI